jgi:hypothetical protein
MKKRAVSKKIKVKLLNIAFIIGKNVKSRWFNPWYFGKKKMSTMARLSTIVIVTIQGVKFLSFEMMG